MTNTNQQPTTHHTPGPWSVNPDEGNGFYVQAMNEPEETIVARCIDYPHMTGLTDGTWEAKANASLIASAPELLEALKQLLANAKYYGLSQKSLTAGTAMAHAVRAIAKAEGRA